MDKTFANTIINTHISMKIREPKLFFTAISARSVRNSLHRALTIVGIPRKVGSSKLGLRVRLGAYKIGANIGFD